MLNRHFYLRVSSHFFLRILVFFSRFSGFYLDLGYQRFMDAFLFSLTRSVENLVDLDGQKTCNDRLLRHVGNTGCDLLLLVGLMANNKRQRNVDEHVGPRQQRKRASQQATSSYQKAVMK